MEARQAFRGSAVPNGILVVLAICAAVALLAVGMLITKNLGGSSAPVTSPVHAAPGTVLRQDNPAQAPAELPSYIQQEIAAKATPRMLQDDPNFIAQYGNTSNGTCPAGSHVAVWYSARTSGCVRG
ncbi:MAG TPA: hypothetical protein VLK30_10395 [Candidatus Limnocylindrales bacterium]|nr:hypothetical protein [Candidatus Limnocylindrales bacterium]